ncbi:MAG: AAA family ATPase [Rhodocyclaceae bacterium]|nr:AAA family ATPase [Rhodocyclaceae bacterium]
MSIMPDTPLSFIQALPDPAHVKVVETHISWVLLAGAFAWKVKKPIKLPFLDYSTVELRRACCEEELRLNRRFAPQLYLDVVDLNGEPAVKMRRFDEALRLDHVCAHCDLTGDHLSAFARDLVAFQATAAVTPAASLFGSAETILADALENFAELEPLLPDAVGHLARLRQWTTAESARRAVDFAARKAAGRVREGHGDLHLGNLVLLDGRVVPFDGIEFNAGFRNIDVASEIAFTLLDLLDHQRPGLATWLLSEWLVWSGDFAALTVLRFYLVYRAMVRAKVAALQEKRDESLTYLSFAARLAAPQSPTLTITCGPSGCGKTHVSSRRLASADFLDTVRIRSDVERKRLFGLAPHDSSAASGGAIYTPEATTRTYARLAELAECALAAGWSVIVDAAFLKRVERDQFRALAARLGVPFAILAPTAPPEELARRIALRQNDASEATVAVLEQQLRWLEPLGPDEI